MQKRKTLAISDFCVLIFAVARRCHRFIELQKNFKTLILIA